jgi:P-type conjugative transfer protein TrbG
MILRPFGLLLPLTVALATAGAGASAAPAGTTASPAPSAAAAGAVAQATAAPKPSAMATSSPATVAPTLAPAPAATMAPPPVILQESRGPYIGTDGALHYPIDAPAEPSLACVPLFVCDVTLEANESILNIATGDSARWLIAAAQSGPGGDTPHVLIKPTSLGLRTNLIVTTNRHVYYLRLNSASTTPYSRLQYFYPSDEAAAAAAAVQAQRIAELAREADQPLKPVGPVDTSYRLWGDSSFLPFRVYADAQHTFIEYSKLPSDLPVLFAVSSDGNDQIVNYRLKDTIFIIDGTPPNIDLVLNAGTGRHGNGERRVHIRHL